MIWLDHTKFATKIFCFCCFATEKVRPYTVRNFDWNSYLRRGGVASKESLLDLTFPAKAFKLDCGVKGPTRLSGCTLVLCQIRQQVKYRLSHRSVQPLQVPYFSAPPSWPLPGCTSQREVNLERGGELGGRRWTWREMNLEGGELEGGGELGGRRWTWREDVNPGEKLFLTTMTVEAWLCPGWGWKVAKAATFSGPQFL